MTSPVTYAVDDKDLDDAALWAVIDSAAAASLSSTKTSAKQRTKTLTPIPFPIPSPQTKSSSYYHQHRHADGEVVQEPGEARQHHRPHKISRSSNASCVSESSPRPLSMVKHVPSTPVCYTNFWEKRKSSEKNYANCSNMSNCSTNYSPNGSDCSTPVSYGYSEDKDMTHSLAGRFPTVPLFKEYQNAAMAILDKSDYTIISGNHYIKKSGWRKISFYFNVSYEIKDKSIEFDDNRNVQRAEFVVRAYMQGGRFSDGWGSCERREKKFLKPNHDIPSTAETRAKNRACQDLLGIGEYRPGASHAHR